MTTMLEKKTHRPSAMQALRNLRIPLFLTVVILVQGLDYAHAAQGDTQKAAAPPKLQATVRTVDPAANTLEVKINKKSATLAVTPDTKIMSRDGSPIALSALQKRDEVKIAWSDVSGKPVADEISVVFPAEYKQGRKSFFGKG
ncbi:MAG TPA: hypothetical protein DDY32_11060 [Desulfobulbaceae bacterium]|nr:hypothetical protein [Desulfobulbaceae bacterium]